MKIYQTIERQDLYGRKNGKIVDKVLYLQNVANNRGAKEEESELAKQSSTNSARLDKLVKDKYKIFSDGLQSETATKVKYGFN